MQSLSVCCYQSITLSDQSALFLSAWWFVCGHHIVLVPPGVGGRVLHDHQPYGCGVDVGHGVGFVLFGGVFSLAVVEDAGDEEDQEENDIAGDKDDEVEGDRVDLHIVCDETHGCAVTGTGGLERHCRRETDL